MALANFFDKINLGASQRLKDYDRSAFESKLLSNCIAIYYGDNAMHYEGRIAMELLTRILARLYPNLKFTNNENGSKEDGFISYLKSIAKSINPVISLENDQVETFVISVGTVPPLRCKIKTFFIGSDNWKALYSPTSPQSTGKSNNPFGAATAACIACANLFRTLFNTELGDPALDNQLSFSAFSQTINSVENDPVLPDIITLNFTLVGAGAIGNAALWAFLQMNNAQGQISLIDKETVTLSNLQRYILMLQDHDKHSKVEVIRELFQAQSKISILKYPARWQEVIGIISSDQLKLLGVALDTTTERLLLQGVLPKKIINAWTSPDCLGISRHFDFGKDVCLACLYMPPEKVKSESEKIALALNMASNEPFIRQYLAKNAPIDEQFIDIVSQFGGIPSEKLSAYRNQPVRVLYSEGICGGRIIPIQSAASGSQDMEVPLAHESVMAGIMLAAEVIIDALHLRSQPIEPLTKMNLLRPLHPFLREKEDKHFSGKCICQDPVFLNRYSDKWTG